MRILAKKNLSHFGSFGLKLKLSAHMINKKEKIKRRILNNLNPAELSTDRGKVISTPFKLSRKDKKHSGRYTPLIPEKKKILRDDC